MPLCTPVCTRGEIIFLIVFCRVTNKKHTVLYTVFGKRDESVGSLTHQNVRTA